MTAPTNALVTGSCPMVSPGQSVHRPLQHQPRPDVGPPRSIDDRDTATAITETAEWRALAAHADEHARRPPARRSSPTTRPGASRWCSRSATSTSTTRSTALTAETLRLLAALARRAGRRGAARRHVRGREDQRDRAAGRAARGAAGPSRHGHRGGRRRRRPRGARGARPDGAPSPSRSARARWAGSHRPADPQRRQHRHRRQRPRAGHGLRGPARTTATATLDAAASCPTSTAPTSGRRPATSTRPRPCSSSCRRRSPRSETMTNAGDGPRLAARRPAATTRAVEPRTSWRCRPTTTRWRPSASTPATCSASGTGSAAATRYDSAVGLSLMIAIGADAVRRDAGRLPRHGHALPHRADRAEHADADGPDRHLVRRLLRRPDPGGAAVRPVPGQAARLPPAARHGEQRQVGDPRRATR